MIKGLKYIICGAVEGCKQKKEGHDKTSERVLVVLTQITGLQLRSLDNTAYFSDIPKSSCTLGRFECVSSDDLLPIIRPMAD